MYQRVKKQFFEYKSVYNVIEMRQKEYKESEEI